MANPLSRTDVRLGLAAAVAAISALGIGAFMLGGSETVRPLGSLLSIAVVAPVEPEVLPGETMEVGALNDGFDRASLERVAEPPMDETLPPSAWVGPPLSAPEDTPRMPMPTPAEKPRPAEIAQGPTDPLADGSQAFGFDKPRPDYAAERRQRWEERDTGAQNPPPAPSSEVVGPVQYFQE